MKKNVCLLLLFLMSLAVLSGCGCKHQWAEATCLSPRTCALCGETEGQPLNHAWTEATCLSPKTCTLCGETEGQPLNHTWLEANYQDAKTCSLCGETEGRPLTASFEEHGLVINLAENCRTLEDGSIAMGEPYDYVTYCYSNPSLDTVGKLYIRDYRVFQSDDTHEAIDGYEWRAVDVMIEFSDENAYRYGYHVEICRENYYAVEDWDDYTTDVSGSQWAYLSETADDCFTTIINYHGTDYPCAFSRENSQSSGWKATAQGHSSQWTASFYVCVPTGYDGVVIGFRDARMPWGDGMYIYDAADSNTLFFRLDNTLYE